MRFRPMLPLALLVGWTLFLWVSRLRNVVGNDELDAAGRGWRIAVVVMFVTLAAAVAIAWRRRAPWLGGAINVLCAVTVAFWSVRGTAIALDDHDAGFIAVHTALMAVSIGLAVWAWRRRDGIVAHVVVGHGSAAGAVEQPGGGTVAQRG